MDSISSSKSGSSSTSKETPFPINPPPTPVDPPPTYFPEAFPYDVFLSFRGIDTRKNFCDHLYDRLAMAGIRTFMDDDQLQKGRNISVQLIRAIEESRIYIVVFSPNYGSSTWCLNELVTINDKMENSRSRVLYPVFYNVEPADVRYQSARFGEAFNQTIQTRIKNDSSVGGRWKKALEFAADRSGFNLRSSALGSNSRLISQIIKEVLLDVKPKTMFVAKYPVGLDSRVNDIYSLLRFETSNHVQFIGIWGMGGSGKSTIAKALYNKILQFFDSSCFVASVRVDSQTPNGILHLQQKLISMLLMRENVTVSSIDEGIEIIRNRLSHMKILIVLDDTDKLDQIDALAGDRSWFGHGSVIIITTRDQHLLNQVQVDGRYKAKKLNYQESSELFNWHSFNNPFTNQTYVFIANKIVSYCCGLPLALEVLGAFLFGRTIEQWYSTFAKLKKNPLPKIQKILQISYDGLDYEEKEIFLDIACFFIGKDIDYVTEILDGSNFSSEIGIGILQEKCLLTVNKNELRMHNLIREMGREIIFQLFPNDPANRSRLWSYQDAKDIIMTNTGTKAIEGLTLASPIKEEINFTTKSFQRMHHLRLLQLDNVMFRGSYINISEKIRWLSWRNCSLERLPTTLQLGNLVVLDMQHSNLRSIWPANTIFNLPRNLKILNLSHSKFLTSTPDFRLVPSLVTLILEGCTSLIEIDPSIGCLESLLVLNLKGCEKIANIPSEICSLRSLGYLNLSGCLNLEELPDDLRGLRDLRELNVDETALTKSPSSLYYLTNLTSLSLRKCAVKDLLPNLTMLAHLYCSREFTPHIHLRRLSLRECNLSDEDIPSNIGYYFYHLRELDLAGNRLSKLPSSFGRLINLESLWLDDWSILTSIPDLPSNLQILIANNIH